MRPKQLQRISTFYAQESILDILFEAYKNKETLSIPQINIRTGFYKENPMSYNMVRGFVYELEKLEKVFCENQTNDYAGDWSLTEQEYINRREYKD